MSDFLRVLIKTFKLKHKLVILSTQATQHLELMDSIYFLW